jgi:hypothetical protein
VSSAIFKWDFGNVETLVKEGKLKKAVVSKPTAAAVNKEKNYLQSTATEDYEAKKLLDFYKVSFYHRLYF